MEEVLIRDKEKLKNFEQVSAIIINDNQDMIKTYSFR